MTREHERSLYDDLVRAHARGLYALAFRFVGDAAEAEDLVQETYVHAWRSIGQLRDAATGRAWLATILRRRWARARRDASRRPPIETGLDDLNELDEPESTLPGPDAAFAGPPERVQRALDRLDPALRETFLLVSLEGLSCREAAERLHIPLGTVLSRIHRARVALRASIREDDGHGDARASAGGRS